MKYPKSVIVAFSTIALLLVGGGVANGEELPTTEEVAVVEEAPAVEEPAKPEPVTPEPAKPAEPAKPEPAKPAEVPVVPVAPEAVEAPATPAESAPAAKPTEPGTAAEAPATPQALPADAPPANASPRNTGFAWAPTHPDSVRANGALTLTVSGDPITSLSVAIKNSSGATVATITDAAPAVGVPLTAPGLPAGTYTTHTTFDGSGAALVQTHTLVGRFATAAASATSPVTAYRGSDGVITATVTSNASTPQAFAPAISFAGAAISCTSPTATAGSPSVCTFSGLPAGDHTVTITPAADMDFDNPVYTFPIAMTEPPAPAPVPANLTVTTTNADHGKANGTATITVCNENPMPEGVDYDVTLAGKTKTVSVAGGGTECGSVTFTGLAAASGLTAVAEGSDGTSATSPSFKVGENAPTPIVGKPTISLRVISADTGTGGSVAATFCNTSKYTGKSVSYSLIVDGVQMAKLGPLPDGACETGTLTGYAAGTHSVRIVGSDGQSASSAFTIASGATSVVSNSPFLTNSEVLKGIEKVKTPGFNSTGISNLPVTGSETTPIIGLALGTVLAGIVLVAMRRRVELGR